MGHREAAAGEYRRALAINPADLGARNNLANILLNTGQINAAIQQYEQLLALYPRYAQGYNNLGGGLSAARQSKKRRAACSKRPYGPIQNTRMLTTT